MAISVILLWFNIFLAFPGAAKPGAQAEGLGLVGTLSGLGSLGGELGTCLLPYLGGEEREVVCELQTRTSHSCEPG